MKTQKEVKQIIFQRYKYHPLVYMGGINLLIKRMRDCEYNNAEDILSEDDIQYKIIINDLSKDAVEEVLNVISEMAKYDFDGSWGLVALKLVNISIYSTNKKIIPVLLKCMVEASKVDKKGKWGGVAFEIYSEVVYRLYYENTSKGRKIVLAIIKAAKNAYNILDKHTYKDNWFDIISKLYKEFSSHSDNSIAKALNKLLIWEV